ncbi:MAG TPA: toxin-antitoxin system HicB family antitoxin [Mycobacterium sp.]|jgi:predicted HicB family RNase H-like nuclease|uniref:toxin-antitoxin system HicB family antitoxin n=1 Tax=Mycobacterium sp. TaxID=1785 RepID=UPI002F41045F
MTTAKTRTDPPPAKVSFTVRLKKPTHRLARIRAYRGKMSLNRYVELAVEEKIERETIERGTRRPAAVS